jgi:DNA-binding response OmpR family regulator
MDPEPKEGAAPARPRILVVDDESDLISVLRFGLEIEGFEVLDAADGEEGLRLAREARPTLMLLDLMLPKMDGYKVCRALKFDERYRAMPIFILSARSGEQDRKLAFEMGADAFVTKPYDMKDLVLKIRTRLGLPSSRQAA